MCNIDFGDTQALAFAYYIGSMGDEQIAVEDLAEWAGALPCELLTNINTRIPRVYLQDQQPSK